MNYVEIERVPGGTPTYVLRHDFDLSMFDLEPAGTTYPSREDAERAATVVLTTLAGAQG